LIYFLLNQNGFSKQSKLILPLSSPFKIDLFKNQKETSNNVAYGNVDKEVLAAIKKVPLQYRAQIIALSHYLQLKKANDQQIKTRVTNVIHKHKKQRVPICEEVAYLYFIFC